jgi:ATP-dependent protease ClpP protease subunit
MTANEAAELRKLEAEADLAEAEARKAQIEADIAELEYQTQKRAEENELANDDNTNHYLFMGEVNPKSVKRCARQLDKWHRQNPEAPVHITLNSGGGTVFDGMHLFDEISAHSIRGGGTHRITITVRGMAASMAGILLQAADHRIIGRESYLMIHEIFSGVVGKLGDIQDEVKILELMCRRVADIFLERCGGRISPELFEASWRRHDWWLDSETVVGYGFADRIG